MYVNVGGHVRTLYRMLCETMLRRLVEKFNQDQDDE